MTVPITTRASDVWLYAVVRADRPLPAGLSGVAGEDVRVVEGQYVSAVVGFVPREDFDEEPLQAHLEDLAWLEETARTHHHVIDELAQSGPCLPMRLATLYHDEQRVTAMLQDRQEDFLSALGRIAGRSEWGVKAYLAQTSAPTDVQAVDDARPGTSYLLRRKAQNEQRREAVQHAVDEAQAVHESVASDIAAASRQHPLQSAEASGRAAPMVLNGAYLIDDEQIAAFEAALESLAAAHPRLHLEVTGPWPAYSFTGIDAQAGAGER